MAVIRVKKTKDYTVMSNYHFREKKLSLKAKGLLSLILSLPENWEYSVEGLTTLSKDGRDGVKAGLKELEKFGFLERKQMYDKAGKFNGHEYIVYEKPLTEKPLAENPPTEKPLTEKPLAENPTQLNTYELNTYKSSNKELNTNKQTNNIEIEKEPLTKEDQDHIELIGGLFASWSLNNHQILFIYQLAKDQIPFEIGMIPEQYDIRVYDGLHRLIMQAKADRVTYIYRWLQTMIPITEF